MTELPEKVQAKLLLQVVVTLVQFHYPRVRELHESVLASIDSLGLTREPNAWTRLTSAYHTLSRELLALMREEDGLVLDKVQILAARGKLAFGGLKDRKDAYEALVTQREQLAVVRRRVEVELVETSPLNTVSPRAPEVRQAIRMFLVATQEMEDFEREALMPVSRVFMVG